MLTYDAVLALQDRLLNGSSDILQEDTKAVVEKKESTFTKVLNAARNLVEKLIAGAVKAVQAFGNFLRGLIGESREVLGNIAKKIDKKKDVSGMQIKGYPFSGLNNAVQVKYKKFNVDDLFRFLDMPVINSWEDLQRYREKQDSSNTSYPNLPAEEKFAKIVEFMTGIKIKAEGNPGQMQDALMRQLWGSENAIVLTGGKDFTVGGEMEKLVNPPIARSIMLSYKQIHKKLMTTKKLLPFMTKGSTVAGKAEKVQRTVERAQLHSDEYVKKHNMSQSEAESMENDLRWEAAFIKYYVSMIRDIATYMNQINRGLITTVKAQNNQCRFILKMAMSYKTPEQRAQKAMDKEQAEEDADPMNKYAESHKQADKTDENKE